MNEEFSFRAKYFLCGPSGIYHRHFIRKSEKDNFLMKYLRIRDILVTRINACSYTIALCLSSNWFAKKGRREIQLTSNPFQSSAL